MNNKRGTVWLDLKRRKSTKDAFTKKRVDLGFKKSLKVSLDVMSNNNIKEQNTIINTILILLNC